MKLFIPAAGLGKRMSSICNWTHKALIPINNKPTISYIIDSFPESIEIVIALGYMGDHIKQFLEICYPQRNINYVNIRNFEGKGSGLTKTLLDCKNYLQEEFFFISCDTLIETKEFVNEKEFSQNWIGLSNFETNHLDIKKYRTIIINKNGDPQKLLNKNEFPENINSRFPYIGFSFIKDFKEFWQAYENISYKDIESGEFIGLSYLFKNGLLSSRKFNWLDTGSPSGYKKSLEKLENCNDVEAIILPKENETIYFQNNKVIKYSINSKFIKDRIDRVENIAKFCPEIIDKKPFFYSYRFLEGETFSKVININNFKNLMIFLQNFWNSNLYKTKNDSFRKKYIIKKFYLEKTILRVEKYLKDKNKNDTYMINGKECGKIFDLIKNLSKEDFFEIDLRSSFHGDCHFENIIQSPEGDFKLLDWRQDFASEKDNGDIYYDYGKLLHGILLPHPMVHLNKFSVKKENSNILISLKLPEVYKEIQDEFQLWHYRNGKNFKKTFLITALIYLNIATLHHEGYNDFLFYYGKYLLSNYINARENKDFFINKKLILI